MVRSRVSHALQGRGVRCLRRRGPLSGQLIVFNRKSKEDSRLAGNHQGLGAPTIRSLSEVPLLVH